MEKFELLEKKMCMELEAIEQKLHGGADMSVQDLDKTDKLVHALKSLATYKAMKDAEEYEGMSGRHDRGSSYADGYSRGYAEGMNHSGRFYPERVIRY